MPARPVSVLSLTTALVPAFLVALASRCAAGDARAIERPAQRLADGTMTEVVTVDFSVTHGTAAHPASGFLNAISSTGPASDIVTGAGVNFLRLPSSYANFAPVESLMDVYARMQQLNPSATPRGGGGGRVDLFDR